MIVILSFNNSDRHIRLIKKHVVSTLVLGACVQFSANNNPSICEGKFLSHLRYDIPACLFQCRSNIFSANITFRELLFFHASIIFYSLYVQLVAMCISLVYVVKRLLITFVNVLPKFVSLL